MPISKSQAQAASERDNAASYATVYARIDDLLVRHGAQRSFKVTFATSLLPFGVSVDRITADYAQVGWNVKLVYDERDGNYLEFT